jgi:hypothetical protein
MTARSWALWAVLLCTATATTWYFGSPGYTLHKMQVAAESNDSDAFSGYVDFASLRKVLRAALLEQTKARYKIGKIKGRGQAIDSSMDAALDGMIAPAVVRAGFVKNGTESAVQLERPSVGVLKLTPDYKLERRGLAVFVVKSPGWSRGGMVFTRHGLAWKLSGVEFPPLN